MKFAEIKIRGVSPLFMHNGQLVDPLNPIVRAIAEITSKRTKQTDADRERVSRLEWEGGLYLDEEGAPTIPGLVMEACIRDGAKESRKGKTVQAGLFVQDSFCRMDYGGPREVDALWEDGRFFSRDAVKVTTSKVMRTRPKFPTWSCSFTVCFDDTVVSDRELQSHVETAGRLKGLCDWRPRHGRFTMESFKVVKS